MLEVSAARGREKLATNHAVELYHLSGDPGERENLANANPAKRDELLNDLLAWFKSTGAKLPDQPNPAYEPGASIPTAGQETDQPAKRPKKGLSRKLKREAAFKEFDTSGDGQVTLAEFKTGPKSWTAGGNPEEVFKRIDTDTSGGFSLAEFKAYVPEKAGKDGR